MKKKDLNNENFENIIALHSTDRRLGGNVIWIFRCLLCDNIFEASTSDVKKIKSCGCLRKKHGHRRIDGDSPSRTYVSWTSMKQRCFNKNHPSYKNYGGRGIEVCERWMVFENFLADMGERPEGLTIDRIDNNGNYEPGNCRWATHFYQQINSRNCILTKNKVKKIRCEENVSQEKIGKKFNVSKSTISKIRRNKSWVEI